MERIKKQYENLVINNEVDSRATNYVEHLEQQLKEAQDKLGGEVVAEFECKAELYEASALIELSNDEGMQLLEHINIDEPCLLKPKENYKVLVIKQGD